jgi:hypothetical protein
MIFRTHLKSSKAFEKSKHSHEFYDLDNFMKLKLWYLLHFKITVQMMLHTSQWFPSKMLIFK